MVESSHPSPSISCLSPIELIHAPNSFHAFREDSIHLSWFPRFSSMWSPFQSIGWSQIPFMYFVCTKCHRLFRDVNASKHGNKCRGTTFRCVDCDEEFCVQDIPQHTDCPKAMKSLVPPLYNPKSVRNRYWCSYRFQQTVECQHSVSSIAWCMRTRTNRWSPCLTFSRKQITFRQRRRDSWRLCNRPVMQTKKRERNCIWRCRSGERRRLRKYAITVTTELDSCVISFP